MFLLCLDLLSYFIGVFVSALPQKHTQDTTPKKMEKTEKERENKERGRPSSGSPSLTKASPVKVANTGNWNTIFFCNCAADT